MDEGKLKAWILYKLIRRRCWGGKHTAFDNLPKGKPKHLAKKIKKSGEELIRMGLLLQKPTSYGLQISLNPKFREEIIKTIADHYDLDEVSIYL